MVRAHRFQRFGDERERALVRDPGQQNHAAALRANACARSLRQRLAADAEIRGARRIDESPTVLGRLVQLDLQQRRAEQQPRAGGTSSCKCRGSSAPKSRPSNDERWRASVTSAAFRRRRRPHSARQT